MARFVSPLIIAAVALSVAADFELKELNAQGGVAEDGSDGLKLSYANGAFQVIRENFGYVYPEENIPNDALENFPDGYFILGVGTTLVRPDGYNSQYSAVANGLDEPYVYGSTVNEELEADVAFVSHLQIDMDSKIYAVNVRASYKFPADFIQFDFEVIIPEGNTEEVRLYAWMDVDLLFDVDVDGPGFHYGDSIVGIKTPDATDQEKVAMGWIHLNGAMWTGYQAESYSCNIASAGQNLPEDGCANPDNEGHGPYYATDFAGAISESQENDGSVGFSINFGTAPGTYTSSSLLFLTKLENLEKIIAPYYTAPRAYASIVSLWVGFAFFLLASLFALIGRCMRSKSVSASLVALINIITALAYLIMVLSDTSFGLYCDGRSFEWLRYAAWALVAPLTVALLANLAHAAHSDALFTALIAFGGVLSLFAGAVSPQCLAAWPLLAFAIACGFVVIVQLLRNFRAAAAANLPADVAKLYAYYVWGLIIAFIGYAIVWGVSEGGKATTPAQEIITFTVLDIFTKVVLNAFLLFGISSYHKYGNTYAWLGNSNVDFDLKA